MTEPEQPEFDSRLEWSAEGAVLLTRACPVVVVVDVLRFTTAVEVAVARGAVVVPRPWVAGRAQADWSSLSPASLRRVPAGARVELASPNGAMVALAARGHAADLAMAAALDVSTAVPRLGGGRSLSSADPGTAGPARAARWPAPAARRR